MVSGKARNPAGVCDGGIDAKEYLETQETGIRIIQLMDYQDLNHLEKVGQELLEVDHGYR